MSKRDFELAEQATTHSVSYFDGRGNVHSSYLDREKFADLIRADEREACAKVCDAFQARDVGMQPAECAGAIRARGNT